MEIPKEGLEALAAQAAPELKDPVDTFRYPVHNIGVRIDLYSMEHEGVTLSVMEKITSQQPMTQLLEIPRQIIIQTLQQLIQKLDDPQVWNEVMQPGSQSGPRILQLQAAGVHPNGEEVDLLSTLSPAQVEAIKTILGADLPEADVLETPAAPSTKLSASDLVDELLGR